MHLTSTVKSIVLTVAFATQCVYAKSRNGYGYFDEKFCVLEWIIYLKRLSLIALMLCGVVLYYVPKSRSYARRACCILIDIVANGLKFVLNTNEIEHEKIKIGDKNNENKELKIQELYRKVYEEDAKNYEQKYINKTDFDNDNHKSIRKYKRKKSRTKHNVDGKHERHRHNRHNRNAINDIMPESDAVMINSSQQIIDEKCEKNNVTVLQDTSPKTRITLCTISADKLKNNTELRQENSLNKKIDSSMISKIIDKNDTKSKLMCENNDYQEYNYISNNLPMTDVSDNLRKINDVQSSNKKLKTITFQKKDNVSNIDTDKKFQDKQNFDCVHEEVAAASQSSKDCATRINKQMDPRYEKLFTKRELHDELQKENCRFLHDVKSFTQDCYENSPVTKNRVKPVLLRVVNWFFGGCPEASRRHRQQIDEVGKEENFEFTNTWLL